MKTILIGAALLVFLTGVTHAEPTVYTDEALYLADLSALGYSPIHESFEDGTVWEDSRNSIVSPGSTPSVTSQGLVWTSNFSQNNIATGTVGGSAPDGAFASYSLAHGVTDDSGLYCDSAEDPDIPIECFQNDGLKIESATGATLYAFGGRIDTANSGKVTFLLDGVDINGNDTDNIDNWQREGDFADNWDFVGVIDTNGFLSAELRELRGKDYQQVLLFADDFTVGTRSIVGDISGDGGVDIGDFTLWGDAFGSSGIGLPEDLSGDGQVDIGDFTIWADNFGNTVGTFGLGPGANAVPEPSTFALFCIGAMAIACCGWRRRIVRRAIFTADRN